MTDRISNVFCIHTINANPIPYAVARLKEETERCGMQFIQVPADTLSVAPGPNGADWLWSNGAPLNLEHAGVIVRDLARKGQYDPALGSAVFTLLIEKNIPTLNGHSWAKTGSLKDKLTQYLVLHRAGLPIIAPTLFFNSATALHAYPDWRWPIIRKPRTGSHGNGVIKIDSIDELAAAGGEHPEHYLWQPCIDADFDLRVFATHTKIIGAIKRQNDTSIVNNVSAGGTATPYTLTKELEEVCMATVQALEADLLGLDIIIDRSNKPYILEIDRSNQFEGFEKATGINLAKIHIDLLSSLYPSKKE